MKKLKPFIKEANEAAKALNRHFIFSIIPSRSYNPDTNETSSKVDLRVRVQNLEDNFAYDWTQDKFFSRLGLIKEYLEDFLDDGIL